MNTEKLLRDFKVFALVTLFYLLLYGALGAVKIWRTPRGAAEQPDFKAEIKALFANKNLLYLCSAIYLFSAMYAVKNVVFRIVLMFTYVGFIVQMVRADLASRNK